ncbi:putative DNA modification/repair radical SAM protein [Chitinophaga pendula]|uniref:putative DNA modification/repair radical SAM protein n=1 Tax=Chitinophaga TaxID=79328 RepID=UPI000BAEE070|nr:MULTISPECIES: putative DNA modification/repair radical SAM protein [Chitinophaga]ASZ12925.1 putative DNA modification/repair radical SAM protein [Chitinophaga sp. MD30]UCJ09447.1 putative DNA modification/repair radical SAM protein [Chitinophaga pendula]
MSERILEKLSILADAAKYDVSCASSGSDRKNHNKGLGNAHPGMGICHTYTADGRCVSLLKVLMTNHCIYDCAYCVSRKSNDIKRAAFTVQEIVDLTINFYRRNYIEGLFLSSGIFKDPDYTMERLVLVAKKLRTEHRFNGYIHLKAIPGISPELTHEAGLYADRLSVNLEIPTEAGLKLLAPEKDRAAMIRPMRYLQQEITRFESEQQTMKHVPKFAPAGQSTQLIVGAGQETDRDIISLADHFYRQFRLKRVYYSGYVPVTTDARLPALQSKVPLIREHRLYQADWLLRFYGFGPQELLSDQHPDLDQDVDPKLGWALRNLHWFPVDINRADRLLLARVPGIGMPTVKRICEARRFGDLNWEQVKKMGIMANRAQYFVSCKGLPPSRGDLNAQQIKRRIIDPAAQQLSLF